MFTTPSGATAHNTFGGSISLNMNDPEIGRLCRTVMQSRSDPSRRAHRDSVQPHGAASLDIEEQIRQKRRVKSLRHSDLLRRQRNDLHRIQMLHDFVLRGVREYPLGG